MRVLVACEFSGVVRDAFTKAGHYAMSCDLLPSETPGKHYQGDVRDVIINRWDLLIAHPPCTHLALSGNRWRKDKDPAVITAALDFAEMLWTAPIPLIALEQPASILGQRIGKCHQVIHPYNFGIPEFKTTWLWLKGLPKLKTGPNLKPPSKETDLMKHREWSKVHRASPGKQRASERSRTYPRIAYQMALQWGAMLQPGFVFEETKLQAGAA